MEKRQALELIENSLKSVLETMGNEPQQVSMDSNLTEDYGIDSLGLLNFIVALEEELQLELDVDEQMEIIQGKVEDIVNIILKVS